VGLRKMLITFSLDVPFIHVSGAVSNRLWGGIERLLVCLIFFRVWLPLGCVDYDLKLFQFAIVAWALWVCRNKMNTEKNLLRK
jgi:hypothetical protein